MSRRRSAPLKPKTILASIVICGTVCLAGIGYVWAKTQIWALGREMKTLETRRDDLKRANDALSRTYAAMCTANELGVRVKRLNLGLAAPQADQMVRLPEPTPIAHQTSEAKSYAARGEQ